MKRAFAWLLLFLLTAPVLAQTPSPGQLGVTKTADPEGVYVRDNTGTWVTIGTMDAGVFTPVSGGGSFVWPGTAGVGVGGATAGSGTMPYVNAYLQDNATIFTKSAPDSAPSVSPPLNAADVNTVCTATPSSQSDCTGTPTANSTFQVTLTNPAHISVTAVVTGGTISAGAMQLEFSQDGVHWLGRGLFLDSNPAPNWKNGLIPPFYGITNGVGFSFYRARLTSWTVTSGTPVVTVTISQGSAAALTYIGNLPMAAFGQFGVGGLVIQGGSSAATPVKVTCPDGTCTGGGGGGSTSPFTPTGNTLASPLAPIASAVSSAAAPSGGTSVLISNTGTSVGYVRLTVGSGTATANDIPIQPGAGCALALGSNTWINVYGGATTGVSMNASAGNGQGNCPTGGGGGTASSGGGASGQTLLSAPIAITSATVTKLITAVAGKYTSITGFDATAAGTGTFQLVYGTGTNCGTGQAAFTGAYSWTAQAGLNKVVGGGPSFVAPIGNDVCALTTTAVGYAGSIQYTQDTTPLLVGAGGGGGGGGTFTWPGTDGVANSTAAAAGTMPAVRAYLPDIAGKTLSVNNPSVQAWGAATGNGVAMGANGPGALDPVTQGKQSAIINISTIGTTQIIPLVAGKATYITAFNVTAGGTGKITFVYGTGTNCSTGQVALTGDYDLDRGGGLAPTAGLGTLLPVPVGNAVCAKTTAAVGEAGFMTYVQL